MEIIPLMLIAVIILLTSCPAPMKVACRGRGGGFTGSAGGAISNGGGYFGGGGTIGPGYRGGNIGSGGSIRDGSNVGSGYRGGVPANGKPGGGGDPGAAIVVIPKKPEDPVKKKKKFPMPPSCKPVVRHCIDVHLYGTAGKPQRGGACCKKFKYAKRCVCQFIKSKESDLHAKADGIVRGCHFTKPNC